MTVIPSFSAACCRAKVLIEKAIGSIISTEFLVILQAAKLGNHFILVADILLGKADHPAQV